MQQTWGLLTDGNLLIVLVGDAGYFLDKEPEKVSNRIPLPSAVFRNFVQQQTVILLGRDPAQQKAVT